MKIEFGFGKKSQIVEVPDDNLTGILTANEMEHKRRGREAVDYALAHPIGAPSLADSIAEARIRKQKDDLHIVIIASDISRPVPSYDILPSILRELAAAGCRKEDITVVFARGSHRGHTVEEQRKLAGEDVYEMVRCIDSDPGDCLHFGETSAGTPIDITRVVAEADYRICTGNIEFHYFAGYSGGCKAIMPGCSTPDAIQCNHRMMIEPESCTANLDTNPVRKDLEEAMRYCGGDYLVNVVLDEHKHIVYAVAGDMTRAHRDGCRYLDKMYIKPLDKKADIVIASQGGAPKDANLYQLQKALDNAARAVRDGGRIILIGACQEGFGNRTFEEWFRQAPDPASMIHRIREDFVLGGHKAAAIAMVMQKADIVLVSELEDDLVKDIFMTPAVSAQEALDEALAYYGPGATVLAMPYGGATLPDNK